MTGSYANYNYTPYSDIDLHIIVDYDALTDVEDLPKEFFNAQCFGRSSMVRKE